MIKASETYSVQKDDFTKLKKLIQLNEENFKKLKKLIKLKNRISKR